MRSKASSASRRALTIRACSFPTCSPTLYGTRRPTSSCRVSSSSCCIRSTCCSVPCSRPSASPTRKTPTMNVSSKTVVIDTPTPGRPGPGPKPQGGRPPPPPPSTRPVSTSSPPPRFLPQLQDAERVFWHRHRIHVHRNARHDGRHDPERLQLSLKYFPVGLGSHE